MFNNNLWPQKKPAHHSIIQISKIWNIQFKQLRQQVTKVLVKDGPLRLARTTIYN